MPVGVHARLFEVAATGLGARPWAPCAEIELDWRQGDGRGFAAWEKSLRDVGLLDEDIERIARLCPVDFAPFLAARPGGLGPLLDRIRGTPAVVEQCTQDTLLAVLPMVQLLPRFEADKRALLDRLTRVTPIAIKLLVQRLGERAFDLAHAYLREVDRSAVARWVVERAIAVRVGEPSMYRDAALALVDDRIATGAVEWLGDVLYDVVVDFPADVGPVFARLAAGMPPLRIGQALDAFDGAWGTKDALPPLVYSDLAALDSEAARRAFGTWLARHRQE